MDRREFILKGTAGGLGLVASTSLFASTFRPGAENKMLNIGMIGTGDRGTGLLHMMQELPQFNPVAICDLIPSRLDNAYTVCGGQAQKFTDYRQLLAVKELDAVFIATPLSLHHQMAVDALAAGKHVYGEKAMTFTLAEARDLVKKVSASKLVFQTGHQYRSAPLYYKVREMIQKGYLGEVTHIDCQWNRNNNWRRLLPNDDPKWERLVNWRMYREYSGGLTAELLSHQIDFINWAFKTHPRTISGFGGIHFYQDGRETFDNVHVLIEYPNNMIGSFSSTLANGKDDYFIEIRGSKGTVRLGYNDGYFYPEKAAAAGTELVDGVSGATRLVSNEKGGIPILSAAENTRKKDGTWYALQEFYTNIVEGKLPESNVFTGAEAAIAVRLANDAMQQHKVFTWKDAYTFSTY